MSKKKDDCMEEQPGWYNGQFWMKSAFAVISSAVTPWSVWAASSFQGGSHPR